MEKTDIPIATQELLDSVGTEGKDVINSVYKIYSGRTKSKGTAFLIKEGVLITNEHVIRGNEAKEVRGFSNSGEEIEFIKIISDFKRDLAILFPKSKIEGGLEIVEDNLSPGIMVCTWGFPLLYDGPAPLLSVGFLSGFVEKNGVKRMVINGAFNNGNSGGPLIKSNSKEVLGVVVAKHLPLITPHIASYLGALSNNKSGLIYTRTDQEGHKEQFAESQIVAEILDYYHKMHQVVLGEAILSGELIKFLEEVKIKRRGN